MAFTPFSKIIGQDKAVQFLRQVVSKGSVPHAYLFTGIPGIGKTTAAMAFTRAINCLEPANGEGCGLCVSCRQVMGRNFPDFEFIEPEGQEIKIGQIRNLIRALHFKTVSGRYRVSIIQRAERMNDESSNAFLKTLEEPPPGNILVLNVTEPRDLLPTIVSRCQKVAFRPIPVPVLAEWLKEKKKLDDEKALVLAKISQGSLGNAIRMCDGDFIEKRQEYLFKLIHLPELSKEQALDMALEYTGKKKKRNSSKLSGGETDLFVLLSIWRTWYRDLLLVKEKSPDDFLINFDFSNKLKKISKGYKIEHLIDGCQVLDQAQRDLQRTRNVDLMMENTVLTLKKLGRKKA